MSAVEAPRIKNKVPFFRSSLYNALIVGATAFIAPGLYNAMTSTGAGGAQSPYLVLRATSVLSCMMIGSFPFLFLPPCVLFLPMICSSS